MRTLCPLFGLLGLIVVLFWTLARPLPVVAAGVTPPAAVQPAPAGLPSLPGQSTTGTAAGTAQGTGSQVVVVNSGPSIDELKQQAPDLLQSGLGGLLGGLAQGLSDVLGVVQGFNFLTQTPPGLSYQHPDVRRLWNAMRTATNAALALIALVGGYNVMLRRQLATRSDGALEFLPRLLVGALLANTSMWWTSLAIDLNNALCQGVGAAGFPGWGRIVGTALLGGGTAMLWTPARLLLALAMLLYLVLCLLLAMQMLMRLALVDLLLVLAPLGLLCWILPQTQRWARLWSSSFAGAVFTQFVQMVAMLLAGNLLVAAVPGTGLAGTALGPLLGMASVVLVLKLPGIVGHQLSDGWGTLRGVLVAQATRAVVPATAARTGAAGSTSGVSAGAGRGGV